jgi:structural maintenance of chromosome 4
MEDLRHREDDLNKTTDKLSKCRKIFDLVKKKRFEEFMEGFNSISTRLKEMYQVTSNKLS